MAGVDIKIKVIFGIDHKTRPQNPTTKVKQNTTPGTTKLAQTVLQTVFKEVRIGPDEV